MRYLLLFGLSMLLYAESFAQVVPDSFYQFSLSGKGYSSKTSVDSACGKYVGALNSLYPSVGFGMTGSRILYSGYGSDKIQCTYKSSTRGSEYVNGGYYQCTQAKPYFNEPTGICSGDPDPPKCPAAGSEKGVVDVTTEYTTGTQVGAAVAKVIVPTGKLADVKFCSGGCVIQTNWDKFVASGSCKQVLEKSANGYYRVYCKTPMDYQGSECKAGTSDSNPFTGAGGGYPEAGSIPSEPAEKNTFDGKCPTGTTPGGVDPTGMTICIGDGKSSNSSSSTETKPSTTVTDSAGNTTKTEVTTQKNADGSTTTTTTKTVTKSDGTTTVDKTTETSNNASGGSGKKDVPDAQKDLCDKNPSLNICQNSQVMGKCGDITCTGDAIQCATARAAAAMQCKQKQDDDDLKASPLTALGASTVAGNDPLSGTLPTKGNGGNVTMPSSLDNSGWLGGGAAFNDVTVSVQGKSITVPLSKATGYLVGLRYALMIVALLVSFRMLSGVILRD